MMRVEKKVRVQLLALAHMLGDERRMAIAGEGSVSGQLSDQRFLLKARKAQLAEISPNQLVEVVASPLLKALTSEKDLSDRAFEQLLINSQVDMKAPTPSSEGLFHAWLLQLPGVQYIGHAHPVAANQLLCSTAAEDFATKRLMPDQIVYCGPESVLVPYKTPGLPLARAIVEKVEAFRERTGQVPRVILLKNHGVVALGARHQEVSAAMAMTEKSARVFAGAASLGGPVFMDEQAVRRVEEQAAKTQRSFS